ncbi:hypothetical protein ACWX0K_15160 [Nitrobacteraceae bacterium UC4446_H13]
MTNPDREELVKLADRMAALPTFKMATVVTVPGVACDERERDLIVTALRRLALEAPAAGDGEPVANWRPVAFRVRKYQGSDQFDVFADEADALTRADARGIDYEGLYLVADRFTAPPTYAAMRAPSDCIDRMDCQLQRVRTEPDIGMTCCTKPGCPHAIRALTAPGATTKSDGGVEGHAGSPKQSYRGSGDKKPGGESLNQAGIKPGPSDLYLSRDAVRQILIEQPDENLDITEGVLADIDAQRQEALRLLKAEDDRQSKLHDLLETIREQIRIGVEPEHRPEGLFNNIQNAVYAMRGRTLLMNDAAITCVLYTDSSSTRSEVMVDIRSGVLSAIRSIYGIGFGTFAGGYQNDSIERAADKIVAMLDQFKIRRK